MSGPPPSSQPPTDPTQLLISAVLDFIRSNLNNIISTWGPDSPQYQSARDIMQAYLAENVRRIHGERVHGRVPVEDTDRQIEELMAGLSLSVTSHPENHSVSRAGSGSGSTSTAKPVGGGGGGGDGDASSKDNPAATRATTSTRPGKGLDEMDVA